MIKEKKRYERKGYGLIVAIFIATSFFTGVPYFGEKVWPQVLEFLEKHQISYTTFFLAVNITLHNVTHISMNLIFWFFYHFEFPFIERYKNNENPWPWQEDPEGWKVLVKKSIVVLFINSNVIPVIIYMLLDKYGLLEPHSMDP